MSRTAPVQRFAIAGENRIRSNRYFHPEFGFLEPTSRLRRGPFSMLFGIGRCGRPGLRFVSIAAIATAAACALVSAEAAFKAELENLLKKQGHIPDDQPEGEAPRCSLCERAMRQFVCSLFLMASLRHWPSSPARDSKNNIARRLVDRRAISNRTRRDQNSAGR